jgi:NADPH2:quinone reductase
MGAYAAQVPDLYSALLAELDELIRLGVLAPGEPSVHSLADGPAAMQALASGTTVGKLAIDPSA